MFVLLAASASPQALQPNQSLKVPRPNAPPPGFWNIFAKTQSSEGPVYHLRGNAEIEGAELMLSADEIDYNEETHKAEARGNAHFQHFERNEELRADKVVYNTHDETGLFYNVRGWTHSRIDARPGVLTTNNPLYFEGQWAERRQDRYILHYGFVTNCKMPNPWWTLRGPKFDIVPDERAIAHHSVFRLRRVPLFYTPYYYKSLEKVPRRSGLLMPNIGNSSQRGRMLGLSAFWAINRSYDVTYLIQDFTQRGLAHHVDFRGKPAAGSGFEAIFYGVQDKGLLLDNGQRLKQGGYSLYTTGTADLGHGFTAKASINYLSSLTFRQAFTESYNEAIFSEVHSTAYVNKEWSSLSFNAVFARLENFESVRPRDEIIIRKLPELDASSRDHQIWSRLPVWVSFESSAGLLDRSQPLFQTPRLVDRADVWPRLTTALYWKGFSLLPGISLRETRYESRYEDGGVAGRNLVRSAREFSAELIAPSIERVFNHKTWLGDKLKHVIEPRAGFDYVAGIREFGSVLRFDETDLMSNTNQAEISLTNRLYAKRGDAVSEVFSWEVAQQRYFDPTFGNAVVPGQRNVLLSPVELTPYAFLNGPRNFSPIVSVMRASPKPNLRLEWRADYDPVVGGIVNSGLTTDVRWSKYFVSAGHNQLRCRPLTPADEDQCALTTPDPSRLLSAKSNQFRGRAGFGNPNHRGWNAAFDSVYDYRLGIMQFATTQVTYNTNCCGISVQYRRFSFGTRNDNQFRVAFAVANIGSFGTLRKQERLF